MNNRNIIIFFLAFLGIILPSEQCDVIEDGIDEKSESVSFCVLIEYLFYILPI